MNMLYLRSACLLLLLSALPALAQITRVPNTTLQLPAAPPSGTISTEIAFPALAFDTPLALATAPGDASRLFVVEKAGRIRVFNLNAPSSSTLFLDISSQVATSGEEGLLGLAFHPNYADNGFFYVFYTTTSPRRDRLARFRVSASNPNAADPSSQLILIDQPDEANNHNGGCLQFGPDGYLYVALGDEGGSNDSFNNAQRIDRDFFAGLLRIDVDNRPGNLTPNPHPAINPGTYRVPADNPWVGISSFNGAPVTPSAVRTEFYAVGLRNPWRFSFDSDGTLYLADVGQNAREEINVVTKGDNLGWAFREGFIAGPKSAPAGVQAKNPIHDYPRTEGRSVTGGVVYRGSAISSLFGAYIFSDFETGKIWALRRNGTAVNVQEIANDLHIAGFGSDPRNGDVLFADLVEGRIKRLVTSTGGPGFPTTLSATGAFADLASLTPHAGIVAYQPNVSFWSDHAIKTRWFSVPDLAKKITFAGDANWSFPEATVWIKHFELELTRGNPATRRRIETRFLVKTATSVYGLTYRWNSAQTDATLVPEAGQDEDFTINTGSGTIVQSWRYPSRTECLACHTPQGGLALSFNTRQLNRSVSYSGTLHNQIKVLSDAGYFTEPVERPEQLPVVARADDPSYSLGFRARSYLSVNCAQCHQPGGPTTGSWDARVSTPLALAGIVNGSLNNPGSDPANRVIVPNDPTHSMILRRIDGSPGFGRMPPVATRLLDSVAISLMTDWINAGAPAGPENWRPADNPPNTVNGLDRRYYLAASGWSSLPLFGNLTPASQDIVPNFSLTGARADNFGYVFDGYLDVPSQGLYTFYTSSDDGSKLYIGGVQVVNNDGLHGIVEASGQIALQPGKHAIRVTFFEATGGQSLTVSWSLQGGFAKTAIPNSALFRALPGSTTSAGSTSAGSTSAGSTSAGSTSAGSTSAGSTSAGSPTAGSTTGGSTSVSGQSPYGGSPVALPGRVQAENFDLGGQGVAYNDSDASNNGNQYRPAEGVDIETSTDVGGGVNVGWISSGEWLEYSVTVASAGTYDLALRVARQPSGTSSVRVLAGPEAALVTLADLAVPSTGGWQTWQTITAPVTLNAGPQILRVQAIGSSFNINYIDVSSAPTTTTGGSTTGSSTTAGSTTGSVSGSDLVVTDIAWTPVSPAPGQAVTFRCTVRNAGGTPTPSGTVIGVAFLVDGSYVTWGADNASGLAAGAEREIIGNGPASFTWTATAGAHTVRAYADDVNRITETVESNNTLDEPLTVAPSSVNGLQAQYFNNTTLSGTPALTRTDATVDFNWGNAAPAPGIGIDNFSVRWTGQIQATTSGAYRFQTESDDGIRLTVNGAQLINNWTDHPPTVNDSSSVNLTAGQRYDVTLEYYERGGGAVARLRWFTPGASTAVAIPSTALFSTP